MKQSITIDNLTFSMEDYARLVHALQGKLSSCLKRAVVCILVDKDNNVVSIESNQCTPPNGICPRLALVTSKENYPPNHCNSEHAEVRALKLAKRMPKRAYLFGHKFFCDDCETLLKSYGIELEIV